MAGYELILARPAPGFLSLIFYMDELLDRISNYCLVIDESHLLNKSVS